MAQAATPGWAVPRRQGGSSWGPVVECCLKGSLDRRDQDYETSSSWHSFKLAHKSILEDEPLVIQAAAVPEKGPGAPLAGAPGEQDSSSERTAGQLLSIGGCRQRTLGARRASGPPGHRFPPGAESRCAMPGSNQRHPVCKTGALPLS